MSCPDLQIAGDFAETEIFCYTQARPFPQREIDEKSEEDNPRKVENESGESVPADEKISDDRNNERFGGQDESDATAFFNLRGDELFRERDHDEEGENAHRGQTGALVHPAYDEDDEDGQGNDGERDGDARQIEEAESFQSETREHADHDDAHKNSDAIFHAVRIEGQQGERDDGRRVDAESFDTDDLAEEGDECRDDGEHEEEEHRLYRHTLFDKKCDERMILHKEESGIKN